MITTETKHLPFLIAPRIVKDPYKKRRIPSASVAVRDVVRNSCWLFERCWYLPVLLRTLPLRISDVMSTLTKIISPFATMIN